jgi:hypothetical protein
MKPKITKTQIKTLTIIGKYTYRIMLVDADGSQWLEAQPVWKGVQRTAENENVLKILLTNDCIQLEKREKQKVK